MAKYRVTQFGHPEKKRGCQGASLKKLLLRYGFLPDCTTTSSVDFDPTSRFRPHETGEPAVHGVAWNAD